MTDKESYVGETHTYICECCGELAEKIERLDNDVKVTKGNCNCKCSCGR